MCVCVYMHVYVVRERQWERAREQERDERFLSTEILTALGLNCLGERQRLQNKGGTNANKKKVFSFSKL